MRRIALSVFIFVVVIITVLSAFGSRETKEKENTDWFIYDSYQNAGDYEAAGEFSAVDGSIKSVVIRWRVGDIIIEEGDDTALTVSESVTGLSDDEKMHILVKDGVLYVEFCASGYNFTRRDRRKPLKLEIPSGLSLTIVTSVSDISINRFTGSALSLESTTGSIHTGDITLSGDLSLKTVTGDLSIGNISAVNAGFHTVSGKVETGKVECDKVRVNVSSGDVRLDDFTVPGDAFFKSSSGNISLSGKTGMLSINTSVGSVSSSFLSVASSAEIKVTTGDIEISSLSAGSADLSASSGNITITSLSSGQTRLTASSGNITISSLSSGPLEISSSIGDVRIDSLETESFSIETTIGDVSLTLLSPSDGRIKTTTGDVYFSPLPVNTALKYESRNGNLSYDGLLSYSDGVFTIGSGDHLISVSTSTGNLTVK